MLVVPFFSFSTSYFFGCYDKGNKLEASELILDS